jgi:hypothetical protein
MSVDFKKQFDEIFGAEEQVFNDPTLRDVAPGLVGRGDARFASKELNPRRQAVSARHFRNPRVRSKEGAFERGGAVAQGSPAGFGAVPSMTNFERGAIARETGGMPGVSGDIGDSSTPGGALGETIGNSLASSMAIKGLMAAAPVAAGGLAMGAPAGAVGSAALGSGVTGMFGGMTGMGLLGLANTIGGEIASGQTAIGATEGLSDIGMNQAQIDAAQQAGYSAAQAPVGTGLLGFAAQSALSNVPGLNVSNPTLNAMNAVSETVAAQQGGLYIPGDDGDIGVGMAAEVATPGGSVGPAGTPGEAGMTAGPVDQGFSLSQTIGDVGGAISAGSSALGTALGQAIGNPTGVGPNPGSATGTGSVQGGMTTGNANAQADLTGMGMAGIGIGGQGSPGGSVGPAGTPGQAGMAAGPGAGAK